MEDEGEDQEDEVEDERDCEECKKTFDVDEKRLVQVPLLQIRGGDGS